MRRDPAQLAVLTGSRRAGKAEHHYLERALVAAGLEPAGLVDVEARARQEQERVASHTNARLSRLGLWGLGYGLLFRPRLVEHGIDPATGGAL